MRKIPLSVSQMIFKRKNILPIVSEINEVLSLSNEPLHLINMMLDTLTEVLQVDCCWVQMVDSESRIFDLVADRGFTQDMKKEMALMDSGNRLGNLVAGFGQSIIIPDLVRDGRYGLSSFSKSGLNSLVAVPLRTYRTHGVMGLASKVKKRFRNDDSQLFLVIASMLSTAVIKAELYQRCLSSEGQRNRNNQADDRKVAKQNIETDGMNQFSLHIHAGTEETDRLTTDPFREHAQQMKTFHQRHATD